MVHGTLFDTQRVLPRNMMDIIIDWYLVYIAIGTEDGGFASFMQHGLHLVVWLLLGGPTTIVRPYRRESVFCLEHK